MCFNDISSVLNLGCAANHWREFWDGAEPVVKQVDEDWLDVERVAAAADRLGMAEEIRLACRETATEILVNRALMELGRRTLALLTEAENIFKFSETHLWPMLPEQSGQSGRLFYAVVMLAGLDKLFARHRKIGIPENITIDTFRDIELWIQIYHQKQGRLGLDEIHWLIKHFHNRIFRLGRLQFDIQNFYLDFRIYKSTQSGETLVLAEPGQKFRPDGQYNGANGIFSPEAWTSTLTENSDSITANPVTSRGAALAKPVTLDKKEWQLVAERGAAALFVHIPTARLKQERMTPPACMDSYCQAGDFFPKYFPALKPRVFFTVTWLLDNQFADILPAESNIVQFQQEFYLLPYKNADNAQAMDRVFGGPVKDWNIAPQKSSLQRAIVQFVQKGHRCRLGAGVKLWQEIENNRNSHLPISKSE